MKSSNRASPAPLGVLLLALACTATSAATTAEVMRSRYMRYQFCMEKTHGQGFYKRLGIETVVNRWGVSEPTARAIAGQPEAVRKVDAACRKANDIEDQPRP